MLGPGWAPEAQRGDGRHDPPQVPVRQGLETRNHCAQGGFKKEPWRGGHSGSLGRKASQRKGRAMLEVGFEGWVEVFRTSKGKKNSMCNGMVVIKEVEHLEIALVQRA